MTPEQIYIAIVAMLIGTIIGGTTIAHLMVKRIKWLIDSHREELIKYEAEVQDLIKRGEELRGFAISIQQILDEKEK